MFKIINYPGDFYLGKDVACVQLYYDLESCKYDSFQLD